MQQGNAQENSVVDLVAYRNNKEVKRTVVLQEEVDAMRVIDEIAHHLLMAVRAIKSFHHSHE